MPGTVLSRKNEEMKATTMWREKRVLRTKSSWRKAKEIGAGEGVSEGIWG